MASFLYEKTFSVVNVRDVLNPTNHDSTIGTIIRLNTALVAVIAILISVRLYVRSRVVRRLGSDDGETPLNSLRCSN